MRHNSQQLARLQDRCNAGCIQRLVHLMGRTAPALLMIEISLVLSYHILRECTASESNLLSSGYFSMT